MSPSNQGADAIQAEAEGPEVPEHVEQLSAEKKAVLSQLCALDDEYLAVETELRAEMAQLQSRFERKVAPMIESRKSQLAAAKLPEFWSHVLQQSLLNELVQEHDEPVLAFLEDIVVESFEDPRTGYKIHFHFAENHFFANKVLTTTYHSAPTSKWDADLELTRLEATKVEWKLAKDVTVERKTKGKGKKKKAVQVPRESFFRMFYPLGPDAMLPPRVDEDSDEEELTDEDQMDELLQSAWMEAETFRNLIVPHAVRHYTGEACPEEDDEDDEDDDDEDDDDDDDDDDDEETEGNESEPKKPLLTKAADAADLD